MELIIGLIIGIFIGMSIMALCSISGNSDKKGK